MTLGISWFIEPAVSLLARSSARNLVAGQLTASSDAQFDALVSGGLDAVVTAIDNVMAWNLRPGHQDFRVVAQIERTMPVSLIARAGINTLEALRGRTLLVDSPANGLIVAARALLDEIGLPFGSYELREAGGGKQRFDALMSGVGDAIVVGPPFEDIAVAQGGIRLARLQQVFPDLPGQGIVARRGLAERRKRELRDWLAQMEQARGAAVADRERTISALGAAGLPELAAKANAAVIPDTFVPAEQGIALLIEQRNRAGLPGGNVGYSDIVDLGLL